MVLVVLSSMTAKAQQFEDIKQLYSDESMRSRFVNTSIMCTKPKCFF